MRRKARNNSASIRLSFLSAVAAVLVVCVVPAALAQSSKRDAARAQYDRAQKMRTSLEGKPQKDRTLEEYKSVVEAYRKVYLITPLALEVTPALMAASELYQDMGRQFDPEYFLLSMDTYQFLLKEYPGTKYRQDALFTIAQIQQNDLNQLGDAKATYQDFLKRYPSSPKADATRQALNEIADALEKEKNPRSSRKVAEQQEAGQQLPRVTSIRQWNAESYTRIVIDLENVVKYQSARISNPDRIYFDLYDVKLSPSLAGKTFEVEDGFLKSIRVGQNKKGMVRIVLDVDKVKEYSAFLLPNPYRLVIDVHGEASTLAKKNPKDEPASSVSVVHADEKPPVPASPKKTETADAAPPPETTNPANPARLATSSPAPKLGRPSRTSTVTLAPPLEPKPTRDGQQSLTRALGLKIGRIVIDAGHGGHDTGTIGPHGLMEKDLCLDIALRLGKLIEQRLPGAEVVYTRKDDTFVPLEERTAIANQAKADLFVSIHANSSHDRAARGIETYYLNFATSAEAMEVAARENALSQSSIHELQDLIKKIARNEKIEESKELAADIQESLSKRLRQSSDAERNRGVKKAPFVVLIGANMPSVLSEISFISNPADEKLLKKTDQRQRVAEGLYHGVESYLQSLNSVSNNRQRLVSDREIAEH
jgi:N-acetylmuramoyl-L-alanine amidase